MKREQIEEWTENPVTEHLLSLINSELDAIGATPVVDCYVPGKPQETQENLVDLTARYNAWAVVIEVLQGDWSYFEDEEDEHRDLPVG
jgi:hypothetical protein